MPKDFDITEKKKDWHKSRDSQVMTSEPLNYNYSTQVKYSKAIRKLVKRMSKTVMREIAEFFDTPDMKLFCAEQVKSAQDASVASQARILTNKLMSRFTWLFNDKANDLAEMMVKSQLKSSRVSLADSLKKLSGGLTIKTNFMTGDLSEVVKSIVAENVSLIKSIADVYLSNVQKSVLRSITFGQGLNQLVPQLKKFRGISERHANNVALDQTRKAYNSINKARMEKVGVKKFKWLHSSGGQRPRKDHIEMNGNTYSFDDLPVIDKKTGERGIPGQAINCFIGSTEISLANGCSNLWRYIHAGDIVTVSLHDGSIFKCTRNHPILTLRGWVNADEIKEGDYLVSGKLNDERIVNNEATKSKTTFEDFFNSFDAIRDGERSPFSEFNFHGDIPKENVDTIVVTDILPDGKKSSTCEDIEKFVLSLSYVIRDSFIPSFNAQVLKSGFSGRFRQFFSFVNGKLRHSDCGCLTAISQDYSLLMQDFRNYLSTNCVSLRQRQDTFALIVSCDDVGDIAIDKVSMFDHGDDIPESFKETRRNSPPTDFVDEREFSKSHSSVKRLLCVEKKAISIFEGHVYTMESYSGWYSVSSADIISKNCKCRMAPVIEFNEGEEG